MKKPSVSVPPSLSVTVQGKQPTAGDAGTSLPLPALPVKALRAPLSDVLLFPDYSVGAARRAILKHHSSNHHLAHTVLRLGKRRGISDFHLSKLEKLKWARH